MASGMVRVTCCSPNSIGSAFRRRNAAAGDYGTPWGSRTWRSRVWPDLSAPEGLHANDRSKFGPLSTLRVSFRSRQHLINRIDAPKLSCYRRPCRRVTQSGRLSAQISWASGRFKRRSDPPPIRRMNGFRVLIMLLVGWRCEGPRTRHVNGHRALSVGSGRSTRPACAELSSALWSPPPARRADCTAGSSSPSFLPTP